MELQSSAFESGGTIPTRYTCEGENVSPPLSWRKVPPGTKSLVLIVDTTFGYTRWTKRWTCRQAPPASRCWTASKSTSWIKLS